MLAMRPEYRQVPLRGGASEHFLCAFQTLISYEDVISIVGLDKHTVVVVRSIKRFSRRSAGFVAHAGFGSCSVVKVGGDSAGFAA